MKIHFQRTGGFGGTKLESTIDCDALGNEDACRLRSLLDEAGLLTGGEGHEEIPGSAGRDRAEHAPRTHEARVRDAFCYRVTVEERDRSRTVEVEEGSIDETLDRLLEWLTAAARASRRGDCS